jgi:hypothetical protein
MCGINGIFAYNPCAGIPTDTELLATREAMRARGPDRAGAWWSGDRRCGLGHRRLAILDLSERAVQPSYPSFLDLPRWRRRFGPLAAVPELGWLARGLALTFAPAARSSSPPSPESAPLSILLPSPPSYKPQWVDRRQHPRVLEVQRRARPCALHRQGSRRDERRALARADPRP